MLPVVPSWNDLISVDEWLRKKRKEEIRAAFLSALRASADDSLTRTTCAARSLSIAADTLASFLATRQQQRALRRRNAKLKAKSLKGQS